MAEDVRVDPVDLRLAAVQVDMAADSLRSQDAEAHGNMHAAQTGWVGASAAALMRLAARWEEESANHYTDFIGHSQDLRSAAVAYTATDNGEASRIADFAARMGM